MLSRPGEPASALTCSPWTSLWCSDGASHNLLPVSRHGPRSAGVSPILESPEMVCSGIADFPATGSPLPATAGPGQLASYDDGTASETAPGSPDVKSVSALLDELLIADPAASQLPAATVAPAEALSPLQRLLALCGQVRSRIRVLDMAHLTYPPWLAK